MPVFRFDKARALVRDVKAFVGLEAGAPRGDESPPDPTDRQDRTKPQAATDERARRQRRAARRGGEGAKEISSKRQELRQIRSKARTEGKRSERVESRKEKKRVQQEIFRLQTEARLANRQPGAAVPGTGALPDFAIIGAMKGGTTWLYHLLTRHPHVEPAAAKELHYFDVVCEDEDIEWYRGCFPRPRMKDGRMTITGEATPYLPHPLAPERMARVIPEALLIAVLRNPVDRTYSHYQQMARKGRETRTFEEAIGIEKLRPHENGDAAESAGDSYQGYVSKSIYADQLPRWAELFGQERMLVLKSEDLFGRTPETLATAYDFLGLPEWMPEEVRQQEPERRRNKGTYRQGMDPSTRQQLERFFEPHNKRLYDYLGRDLGW